MKKTYMAPASASLQFAASQMLAASKNTLEVGSGDILIEEDTEIRSTEKNWGGAAWNE